MSDSMMWNDLLKLAQAGDQEAQNRLCEQLNVRLRPVLKYRLRGWSEQDREDLLQDTQVVLLENLHKIESNPQQYALVVLRNKIGNALQKRRTSIHLSIESSAEADSEGETRNAARVISSGEEESSFLDRLDKKITVEIILAALTNLSDFCRQFFLGILEGMSIREVWDGVKSREAGLQRSTFDKRTFDCRKRLRSLVESQM